MSNFVYGKAKEAFLSGLIDLTTHTIKASLLTSAYTPNAASHQFQTSITSALCSGTTDQTLTTKTVTGGKFTCDPITWPLVTSGDVVTYVVFYDASGGSAGANRLVACFDTATGLPLTSDGNDVKFTPDGTNGVFTL